MPTLAAPTAATTNFVNAATADDPIWAVLPDIEACVRRFYGLVNFGASGIAYPAFVTSDLGRAYIAALAYKFDGFAQRLNHSRPDQIAVTCGILRLLDQLAAVSSLIYVCTIKPLTSNSDVASIHRT